MVVNFEIRHYKFCIKNNGCKNYRNYGINGGCPTIELVRELGIDYKDVIKYIKSFQ